MFLAGGNTSVLVEQDGWQVPGSWHPEGRFLAYVKVGRTRGQTWGGQQKSEIWFHKQQAH
jgi:Tol biopolymer transport system component